MLNKNIYEFAYSLQNGKNLSDMYADVEKRQKKLLFCAIDIVISITFYLCGKNQKVNFLLNDIIDKDKEFKLKEIIELMDKNYIISSRYLSEKYNSEDIVYIINKLCSNFFQIINAPIKSKERASEKIETKYLNNPAFISDITRLSITPQSPHYVDLIRCYLQTKKINSLIKDSWSLRLSGILSYSCYLEIDGYVSEIKVDNFYQMQTNFYLSHRIYEITRLMMGINRIFLYDISLETRKKIMKGYNYIMKNYSKIDDSYIISTPKEKISFFLGDSLFNRYQELILLHQSIHVKTISNANIEWRTLFYDLAIKLNDKSMTIKNKETFPNFLLKKLNLF